MSIPVPIEKINLGIRFGPTYSIRDRLGAIIDEILREKDSPFGPALFSLSQSGPHQHRLFNPNTDEQLIVSERDLVLSKLVESQAIDEVRHLCRQFVRYILEPVREIGKVRGISRHGILFELAECSARLARPLTQHYLADECPEARDLTLRFSRRMPTDEAHFRKGVNDYRNAIYTLQQDEAGATRISIDYQEYFDPPLDGEDWRHKPFEAFADAGMGYFDRQFSKWLKSLLAEDRAA